MNLAEKYRPQTWDQVRWQDKTVRLLRRLCNAGIGGHAVYLYGKSGQGKSSLASIAAAEFADETNTWEYDGASLKVEDLEEIKERCSYRVMGHKPGRAFIVDEFHLIRKVVYSRLLKMLEKLPDDQAWFLTTTLVGKQLTLEDIDGEPMLSRFNRFKLSERLGAEEIAEYVREIAQAEGLDGQPLAKYVKMVNKYHGNIRACLTAVESGEMLDGSSDDE